jgi:methylmalonyl-CoA mutase
LPPAFQDTPNGWQICETIQVVEPSAANRQALDALNGGVESLEFIFENPVEWSDMEVLMAGIHLDYIGLHFSGRAVAQNPSAIFSHLTRLADEAGIATTALQGSVAFDPLQAGNIVVDWRYLGDLLAFTQDTFSGFKVITLEFSSNENPVAALSETLSVANMYLKKLQERGVDPVLAAGAMQFSVPVGSSYFLEIAKIRALKLLWINVLNGWGAPVDYPVIAASFKPDTYSSDLYTNMIRATTMAMSAVLGGAERLTVLPYDAGREAAATYPVAFGRRIARNVQHLMKMESQLDAAADPVAGSYYMEKLTGMMAEKAWIDFPGLKDLESL